MLHAFHSQPAIKAQYLARVRAHRMADEIRHGHYWRKGKGCAVGCTLHSTDPTAYERELGIPHILAQLEDSIFEGLSAPEDAAWPERFLESIGVGANLEMIWPQFALALLADPEHGVLRHVQEVQHSVKRHSIEKVVRYYTDWVHTGIKPAAAADPIAAADPAHVATTAAAAAHAAAAAAYSAAEKRLARMWQSEVLLKLLRAAS